MNILEQEYEKNPDIGRRNLAKATGVSEAKCRSFLDEKRVSSEQKVEKTKDKLYTEISNKYSTEELKVIAKGINSVEHPKHIHNFNGNSITLGVLTDTHFGSTSTDPSIMDSIFAEFKKNKVDFVFHAGDVTEGFGRREGMCFEQSHIGYDAQKKHAIDILSKWQDSPIYMISGNHDSWYTKSVGADIVEEICKALPNAHYLGYGEGNVEINNVIFKLWHGEDASSYAMSYRVQKIVESFTGGEKPHVLIAGHTHKAFYIYDRNVHCISAGCIQRQSKWMRMKRLAAHTGFWIVKLTLNEKGVGTFTPTFYPFYV